MRYYQKIRAFEKDPDRPAPGPLSPSALQPASLSYAMDCTGANRSNSDYTHLPRHKASRICDLSYVLCYLVFRRIFLGRIGGENTTAGHGQKCGRECSHSTVNELFCLRSAVIYFLLGGRPPESKLHDPSTGVAVYDPRAWPGDKQCESLQVG
jgi:hypothetical protein